jgi:hybrid cluster-associated redox disulfide protein
MTSSPERDPTLESLSIDALLDRWPAAAEVFIRYHMACIGCDFSGFHTPLDAAREYKIAGQQFFLDLKDVMIAIDRD